MTEFTISFSYNNEAQKARVLMSGHYPKVEYNVRPVDPSIVRKYGMQINIFKDNEVYQTKSRVGSKHKEFINCLVKAIQAQSSTLS